LDVGISNEEHFPKSIAPRGLVPFELVVSAALLCREIYGGGGQIVFQIFTTII
jgi:hypothetical protein